MNAPAPHLLIRALIAPATPGHGPMSSFGLTQAADPIFAEHNLARAPRA